MSLKGIDISNHQRGLDLSKIDCDFVIIKATEGKSYVDPSCDTFFQKALSLGKKLGVYHFANNSDNTAQQEADWFIQNTRGYIGKAIPVLDWEDNITDNVPWALEWLKRVEEAYGCKPIIYMSESVVNRHDWSSVANANYGIWVAKYRDNLPDYNYDMSKAGNMPSIKYWSTMALWQWTSTGRLNGWNGNLDLDVFYGDATAWDKYLGSGSGVVTPSNPKPSAPVEQPSKSYQTYTVQSGDTLSGIAAKFGTTYQKIAADNGIANPNIIHPGQVLKIYGGSNQSNSAPSYQTYTVKSGDTLSGIGSKFGVSYQKIAADNNISNPNLIHPGQVLKIYTDQPQQPVYETYIVKSGDTLSEIAQQFGTTVDKIAKDNGINNVNLITIGQKLKIYR